LRAPGVGETKALDENFFMEVALRATVLNGLSDNDLETYREPYPTRDSRRPLLQWPRAFPIEGEPADVVSRVEAYDAWLASSADVPRRSPGGPIGISSARTTRPRPRRLKLTTAHLLAIVR
jgi:haloalkane dehalogenase